MEASGPVMVGIDGSTASVRAAVWAADEAAARDTAVDLVYVVDSARVEDSDEAMADARNAIHRAWAAVAESDKHVKVESEILEGNPAIELANAARRAALICVGHKGVKDSAPLSRGSTASSLARMAPATVAVVRRRHMHRRPSFHRWIVALLDESSASHAVLRAALDEAALRRAPVLALTTWSTGDSVEPESSTKAGGIRTEIEQYLRDSRTHPADVQVCALRLPDDLLNLLEQSASIEQLFVVSSRRHDFVDQLTGSRARKAMRGTNCSVLVVHDEALMTEPGAPAEEDSDS
ncbi:universal stress protein [Mycolicibacterium sp. P9-64]|uniref:universal stress protein n=1 Tax=Mycolicibacterium sp. P9-64 TaxID=2024612 RepID=UPI001563FE57|nr:universal stress protein [Mycolicibacterium sp. P9-64]